MVKWWHQSWRFALLLIPRQAAAVRLIPSLRQNTTNGRGKQACVRGSVRWEAEFFGEAEVCGDILRGYGEMMTSELKTPKIKKNDYNLSFAQLKTTKRMTTIWALHFARKRITGTSKVVCDVAVRTICVASDAPVSRSCKTYPVTQTKHNKWTGEASLRPGKCKMRSCVLWRSRVLWRHLEGIWWNDDMYYWRLQKEWLQFEL